MLRGIHKICDKSQWDDARRLLLSSNPPIDHATRPAGRGNWTPLHLACRRKNPPLDVILALIDAAPIAARTFDAYHRLPLHYAAESGSEEVVCALYDANPSAVCDVDHEGYTPLHLSLLASSPEYNPVNPRIPPTREEVQLLLDDEGAVSRTVDHNGNTPLHCVCDTIDYCCPEVLEILVRANAHALIERNANGLTPLHKALLKSVERPMTLGPITMLLTIDEVTRMDDGEGRLPLHCACLNFASVDVIKELLRRYPGAASIQTSEGKYPLTILEQVRGKMTTDDEIDDLNRKSDLLFAYHPHIPPYCNDIDRLERFGMRLCDDIDDMLGLSETSRLVWRWIISVDERNDPEGLYLSIITSIVRCLGVEGARTLALLLDEESGKCYHEIAAAQTKKLLKSYLRFADRYEMGDDDSSSSSSKVDNEQANDKVVIVERTSTSLTMRARDYYEEMMTDDPLLRGNGTTEPRRVLIKFFSHRTDFEREASYPNTSSGNDDNIPPLPVVPIIETYNIDRIGTTDEMMGDCSYQRDLQTSKISSTGGWDVSRYPYAIVTPATGKSLSHIFNNGKCGEDVDSGDGGLSEAEMRRYVRQLAHALSNLHQHGLSYNSINLSLIVTYNNNALLFSSLSSMTTIISPDQNFHGLPTSSLKSAMLPPEMIAKLDCDGVNQYYKYWKPVIRDARVYQLCCVPQDLAFISHCVNDYLGVNGEIETTGASFSHLWDRVKENAKLWKRIRPRSIDNSYYVIKCYATLRSPFTTTNSLSIPSPLHPHRLPYPLLPQSPTIDVWTFALFLFSHATNTTSTTSTNETLFATNNQGNLCHNADFATLYHWNIDSPYADERFDTIDDPLLRDLLRILLVPDDERPETLEEILNHPFFMWDVQDSSLQEYARNVIVMEDNRKRDRKETALMEKSVVMRREIEECWLSEHTRIVERLTPRMYLTMDRATWSRWTSCLMMEGEECVPEGGSTFPTCYIVVPYEMMMWDEDGESCEDEYNDVNKNGVGTARAATTTASVVSAPHDTEIAIATGRLFARWLYFTSLVSLIESSPRYSNGDDDNESFQTDTSKLSHFTDLNRAAMAYAETNVIDICEGIVKRASNAMTIMVEVLEKYLPNCDIELSDGNIETRSSAAKTVADVIVRQVLADIVDLGVCEDITKRAKEAGEAFTVFSKHINDDIDGDLKKWRKHNNNPATNDDSSTRSDDDVKASMRLVNENYEELLGSDFCSQSISRKMDVEMALFGLIKDFVEDPLSATKTMSMRVMNDLMEHMLRQEQFYFYLVDELTGRPVVQRQQRYQQQQQELSEEEDHEGNGVVANYPFALEATRETLGLLTPGLYLSLRSLVETSGVLGLGKLLGLEMSRIPKEWKSIASPTYMTSSTSTNASHMEMEYRFLRDILEQQSSSNNNHDDNNFNYNDHNVDNNNTISYAASDVLSSYEQFLQSFDPSRDYSGMHRVCGPDDLVLWTSDAGEMSIQRDDQRDLETLSMATRKEADEVLERLWKTTSDKQQSESTTALTTRGDNNNSKRRWMKSHLNSYQRQEGLKIWSHDDALRALTDDKLLNKKMDNNMLLLPKAPLLPKVVMADESQQSLRMSFSEDSSIVTMTDATFISAFGHDTTAGAQSLTTLVVYDENNKALTTCQHNDDGSSTGTATITPYHEMETSTAASSKKQKTPASLSFRTSLRSDREKLNQEERKKMLGGGGGGSSGSIIMKKNHTSASSPSVTTLATKEKAEGSSSLSPLVKGINSGNSNIIMKAERQQQQQQQQQHNMRSGVIASAMTTTGTNSTTSSTAFRSFHKKKTETDIATSSTDHQQRQDDNSNNSNNKAGGGEWLKKKIKNNSNNGLSPPPPPTSPQPAVSSTSRILSSPPQNRNFMSSRSMSSPAADGVNGVTTVELQGAKKTLFGKGNNNNDSIASTAGSGTNTMMAHNDDQLKTPRRFDKFSNTTTTHTATGQATAAAVQFEENNEVESDFVITQEQQRQEQQDYEDDGYQQQDLPYGQNNKNLSSIDNATPDDNINNVDNKNSNDNDHLTIQQAQSYESDDASYASTESKLAVARYLGPIRAAASPAHQLTKKQQQQDENGGSGARKWNNIFKERSAAAATQQQPPPPKTMKTVGLGMNNAGAPGRNVMMNDVTTVAATGTTTVATGGDESNDDRNNIGDDSGHDQICHNISEVSLSPQIQESTEAAQDKLNGQKQQQQQGGSSKYASPFRRSPTNSSNKNNNNNNINNNYNLRGNTPSPYRTSNNPMRTSTPRGAQNVQNGFKRLDNNSGTTTTNNRPFDSPAKSTLAMNSKYNSVEGDSNGVDNTTTYDNENNMNSANSITNSSKPSMAVNGEMMKNKGGSKGGLMTVETPRRRFNMNTYPPQQSSTTNIDTQTNNNINNSSSSNGDKSSSSASAFRSSPYQQFSFSSANNDHQTNSNNNNSNSRNGNNAPPYPQTSSSSASPFRSSPYKQRNNDYRMTMNKSNSGSNNDSLPHSHSFPTPLPPQQPPQRLNHPPTLEQTQQQETPPKQRRSPTSLHCPSPSAFHSSSSNNTAPWMSSTPTQSSRRPSSSRHSTSSSQQNMFSMRNVSTPMGSALPSKSFSTDDGHNNNNNGNVLSRGGGNGSGGYQQQPQRSRNDFFRQYRSQLGDKN